MPFVAQNIVFYFLFSKPEVLETLVQAGADLGATTKNGETPLDICEDPDLRELIEKLKSDMEARRLLQQQQMQLQQQQQLLQQNNANANQGRLKRSHSQNTRSQSVRRTSIREKSQISRREAREEAKLRRNSDEEIQKQVQQESQSETNGDTSTIKSTMTSGSNVNSSGGGLESGNETSPATKADDVEPLADLSIGQDQTDRPSVFNSQPESIINGNSHINNNVHNDLEQNSQAPLTGSKLTAARNGSILESSPAVNAALFGSPFASLDGQMGIVNERPIDCNGIEPVIVDDLKLARQLARNELPVGTYSNSNGAGYSGMGTLADLKKQRADLRNRFAFDAPTVEQMQTMRSIQNNHLNGNGLLLNGSLDSNANQNAAISNGRFTLNSKTHPPSLGSTGINGGSNLTDRSRVTSGTGVSFLHPPSPSCTLKKFCGDPTDVVGEMNQKGCCLLM